MILLPHSEPLALPSLPKGVATRALYDFSRSDILDQTGNGYTLTRNAAPRIGHAGGRQVRILTGAGSDDAYTGSTSVIADTDHFIAWAWVFIRDRNSFPIIQRGRDGYGTGWSVSLELTADGKGFCAIITTVPYVSYQEGTATTGRVKLGEWNFVAMIAQHTYGVEPSHITSYAGKTLSRHGLGGHATLRGSSVGIQLAGALGASYGNYRTKNALGALGIELIPSLTEAQALARMYEVERVTRPYFTAASTDVLYIPSDAAASFPAYRAQRAQQHLMVR